MLPALVLVRSRVAYTHVCLFFALRVNFWSLFSIFSSNSLKIIHTVPGLAIRSFIFWQEEMRNEKSWNIFHWQRICLQIRTAPTQLSSLILSIFLLTSTLALRAFWSKKCSKIVSVLAQNQLFLALFWLFSMIFSHFWSIFYYFWTFLPDFTSFSSKFKIIFLKFLEGSYPSTNSRFFL